MADEQAEEQNRDRGETEEMVATATEETGESTAEAEGDELFTLTEVSEHTGISMPTLQRYKKSYQKRIPSKGKGRRQRYPREAFEVFEEIKQENIKKRGRPKSSGKKKAKKGSKAKDSGLLTLTRVAEETGISYPTLVRYVKLHEDRIPFEGTGRSRRYHPRAVEVFREIRDESPRGRRSRSGGSGGGVSPQLAQQIKALERSHAKLEKQVKDLIKEVRKPLRVTIRR
jgi:hypothetical protein